MAVRELVIRNCPHPVRDTLFQRHYMAQLNVMPCQINLHWLRNTFKNVPVKKAEAISLKYLSPALCSAEKFLKILKLKDFY